MKMIGFGKMEEGKNQPAAQLCAATTKGISSSQEEHQIADEQIRPDLNKPVRRTIKPAAHVNSSFQRKS